jgi:hypothetical protein
MPMAAWSGFKKAVAITANATPGSKADLYPRFVVTDLCSAAGQVLSGRLFWCEVGPM